MRTGWKRASVRLDMREKMWERKAEVEAMVSRSLRVAMGRRTTPVTREGMRTLGLRLAMTMMDTRDVRMTVTATITMMSTRLNTSSPCSC